MASPVLQIEDLWIEREAPILRGVSWQIQPGEHWVILGPNGCGKTSLLSAVSGYLPPTRGKITVLGETYGTTDWRKLREKIGLVSASVQQKIEPGETALETVVSGRYAMINYWGQIRPEDRRAARKILRNMQALRLAERAWLYLSQGERQRVLIGRALMACPELLILDEPCAGLDPVARERFLQFLQKWAAQPHTPTLILVTHHVEEIMPIFSHTLVMRAGQAVARGSQAKVLRSTVLSEAFSAQIVLRKTGGRYRLHFAETPSGSSEFLELRKR